MLEFPPRLRLVSLALGASALVTLASAGCVVHHHHSHGPSVHTVKVPPRSAAHGYVHHYHDVVLVFDRSWKGYWVRGHPHHYFYLDYYYRWHAGRWQRALRFGGPWTSVELRALPAGLRRREMAEERREAVKEKREVAKERRDAARERREELREAAKEKREERREVAKERREAARERREERREAAAEKREERREAVRERRETAESEKSRRGAKPAGELARGSAEHRRPTVPKEAEEELPAKHGVE